MARDADYLLIDVSNSYVKFAFSSTTRISRPTRIATQKVSARVVTGFLRQRKLRKVIVSSVVPAKNRAISNAAQEKGRLLWLDHTLNLGVAIDYPKPQSIGADRLANAAAVAEIHGFPAIAVDFGTAVTFDIVSERRTYIGGVIAPGLEAMMGFLYERTALLPGISIKEPRRVIGKSTIEAMRSGAIFGYRGLVREILARIRAEQFPRKRIQVVATGGYAHLIARGLPEIDVVHPHLTLEGLRIAANLND